MVPRRRMRAQLRHQRLRTAARHRARPPHAVHCMWGLAGAAGESSATVMVIRTCLLRERGISNARRPQAPEGAGVLLSG